MAALMAAAYSCGVADYLAFVQSADGSVEYSYDSTGQLVAATYSGAGCQPAESYSWVSVRRNAC